MHPGAHVDVDQSYACHVHLHRDHGDGHVRCALNPLLDHHCDDDRGLLQDVLTSLHYDDPHGRHAPNVHDELGVHGANFQSLLKIAGALEHHVHHHRAGEVHGGHVHPVES